MKLHARLKLIFSKLTALFILKLTYVRAAQILFGIFCTAFLLLFIIKLNPICGLLSFLFLLPLAGVLLMKPFDNIIVISRLTGSPHVLIKNREVISSCFQGNKLNSIKLMKLIKKSMYKFLYECAQNSKRTYIITYTHKLMFLFLGLDKFDFITDVKEIRPGAIRDKLLFISFRDIWEMKDVSNLLRKVPYYSFKVDINLLREYARQNPAAL